MLEAEVKGPYNQFYKVFINNILDKEATILINCESKAPLKIPLSFIYKVPPIDSQSQIKIGDEIEVYIQPNNINSIKPPNLEWSNEYEHIFNQLAEFTENLAWWPAHVQNIRGDYLIVKITGIESCKDVVERSIVRLVMTLNADDKSSLVRKPLNELSYFKREIDIPQELSSCSKDSTVHKDLLRPCKSSATLYYDEANSKLIVYSFDPDVIRQVELLEDTHLRMVRQKWTLMQSMNLASKRLQYSRIANKNVNEVESFTIPHGCMGLAIGSKGVNIQQARQIEGVISIDVNDKTCGFTIYAKTKEAAKAARKILEFSEANMEVSQHLVARIIGKNGVNIQSIVDKSGVIRVRIENNKPNDSKSNPTLRHGAKIDGAKLVKDTHKKSSSVNERFEKSKSISESKDLISCHDFMFNSSDKDFVNFVFIGTLESIENVKLLINFQVETLQDLDKIQAEKAEILRELHSVEYQSNQFMPVQSWSCMLSNYGPSNFIRPGSPHIFLPGQSHQRLMQPIRSAPGNAPFFGSSCNNVPIFTGMNSNRYSSRFSNPTNIRLESDYINPPMDQYSLVLGGSLSGSNVRGKQIFKYGREDGGNPTNQPPCNRQRSNKSRISHPVSNSIRIESKKSVISRNDNSNSIKTNLHSNGR